MTHPDAKLFRPVMRLRYAIIAVMLAFHAIFWKFWIGIERGVPASTQYGVMCGILAADAILTVFFFLGLGPRRTAVFVHLCLLTDIVATTGLIMSTGYVGSPSLFQLLYVLIVVAAGLLYGQSSGAYYLLIISLANVLAVLVDHVDLLHATLTSRPLRPDSPSDIIMAVAVPLVAFYMLLTVKLTQHGRYLQSLYENVSDGLLILDDAGRVVDTNSKAAQMTGRSRQELIGATLESLAASEDGSGATIAEQFRRCLVGEAVSFELSLARRNGDPLPVEISAQSVTGLSPGRVQAFARDISARRIMEAEIRRQNAELRRINQELQVGRDLALNASRLKSQFLANMSHELRTPLNSIIGYTQFVLEDRERPLADDQQEDLDRVLRAGRHLLDLINGVLDLARIESGRESVSISRFGLMDLIESVIDAVTPMAKDKALRVECEIEPGLPELQTDEKKLRQILLNLLANAVKFTERGSVRVACSRDGADLVRIDVRDSGIGVPADHLDEIFSEFHQVDSTIHKQYGGTGLGLAIVKRLVELLKGTIQVQSVVGSGSTFTVTIPLTLATAHDAAGSTTVVPVRTAPPAAPVERRGVVLVIDDELDARQMLARQLGEVGYRVVTASSGTEGFQAARELLPAAITLDVQMPGEHDGREVLAQLRRDPRTSNIPVVVVSVAPEMVGPEIAGACANVTKPVQSGQLREVLERLGVRPDAAKY